MNEEHLRQTIVQLEAELDLQEDTIMWLRVALGTAWLALMIVMAVSL